MIVEVQAESDKIVVRMDGQELKMSVVDAPAIGRAILRKAKEIHARD